MVRFNNWIILAMKNKDSLLQNIHEVVATYNCHKRLNDRYEFEETFRLHHRAKSNSHNVDLFAIADAVVKRG